MKKILELLEVIRVYIGLMIGSLGLLFYKIRYCLFMKKNKKTESDCEIMELELQKILKEENRNCLLSNIDIKKITKEYLED